MEDEISLQRPSQGSRNSDSLNSHLIQLSADQKHELDMHAALAVYMGARPFTILQESYMRRYQDSLCDYSHINYHPPGREALASTLLTEHYTNLKKEVDEIIRRERYINIIFDSSEDIAGNRIINICVITRLGAFYYETFDSGSMRENANTLFHWILTKIDDIVGTDGWKRVNAIITDTCATMRAVWRLFNNHPKTQHIFTIPCDSHGLQLLIKDLLTVQPLSTNLASCQEIAKNFKKSRLQYAWLREYQLKINGCYSAFCLSVITRWGTQDALITSVLKNKEALKAYVRDPRTSGVLKPSIRNIIQDPQFWFMLEEMKPLVSLIAGPQKQSELDRGHVGQVWKRWKEISTSITEMTGECRTLMTENLNTIDIINLCEFRRNLQTLPIHILAFFLDPSYRGPRPSPNEWNSILTFLQQYENPTLRKGEARIQLGNFLIQTAQFAIFHPIWNLAERPLAFWTEACLESPELGELAVRIFSTPTCSVPSERAFSTQNIIHDKIRSNLSLGLTNMLSYIHVNRRILDRHEAEIRSWHQVEDSELAEIESQLIGGILEEPEWV